MINAPVNIPLTMARCPDTRTEPCSKSGSCARALASAAGRAVQDYSIEMRDSVGACTYYLPAVNFRGQAVDTKPSYEYVRGLL